MCGIAGLVNASGATQAHVRRMIDQILYRGHDHIGIETPAEHVIIGHNRLAIVDLINGNQPLSNAEKSVWVTCNGEIYNYVELREELIAKGYFFRTKCDTEVLLHLWREYGENMLDKLIGMFAFFLWDNKNNRGILARDRQGIKPCFIAEYKNGVAFASEMKAILSLPEMVCEVNPAGLKDVFTFNYCPPPQTCFKGIFHLDPGCYLLFEGAKKPVKKRYWQWPFFAEKITPSFEEFEALMDESVRIQMRFDVDGGMYLSGGVDSSVVGYHLRKQWKLPKFEAFGLNFPLEGFSEFRYSQEAAALLDIDLHEVRITPDMIPGIAQNVVFHAEQPHGDFSFFLFYLLAQRTRSLDKKVIFNGDGPDETLGGQFFHSRPDMDFSKDTYFKAISYMTAAERKTLLNPDFERETPDPYTRYEALLEPWKTLGPIEQIVAYECTSLLPGNNLVKGERMGAAWLIEGRAPLLDHRISELFLRLPVDQKFRDGISKYYFKKYAATKFPSELIFKKKTMPTLPIGEWMKTTLHDWTRDTLARGDGTYVNKKAALALLDEHTAGTHNHTRTLRTLLMTQVWLEHCVGALREQKAA